MEVQKELNRGTASARQLHLFVPPRPLLERLGEDFFRRIPRQPGVYVMTSQEGCVLYVGQSKNLRARLGSYKNAQPDRAPAKVIRLVRMVQSITWETCPSPEAAQLRENQLLRLHRPRFNRLNTWPKRYRFLCVKAVDDSLELMRTQEPEAGASVYGAFKGSGSAYAALLRLLWSALHQPVSLQDFPLRLLNAAPPPRFGFPSGANRFAAPLHCFLDGTSDDLLAMVAQSLAAAESLCPFHRALLALDNECLARFFKVGPARNRLIRTRHQLPGHTIAQEELDDFLTEAM